MVISNMKFFHFWGGGLSGLKFQKGDFWGIETKIYCLRSTVQKPSCASQIVSHILMTNEKTDHAVFWAPQFLGDGPLKYSGSAPDYFTFTLVLMLPADQ